MCCRVLNLSVLRDGSIYRSSLIAKMVVTALFASICSLTHPLRYSYYAEYMVFSCTPFKVLYVLASHGGTDIMAALFLSQSLIVLVDFALIKSLVSR